MGCELGKLAFVQRSGSAGSGGGGGGGGGENVASPPVPAPADPRLPLTAKQRYSMLASWKGISRAMEQTGVYMFLRLFEEHEELLELFSRFRELKSPEQRAASLELQEHAATVMHTLNEAILALDDVDACLAFLDGVGASHRKVPGFHTEYFWKLEQPFLQAVSMTLGDRYTENVENIYKITIKFILEAVIRGFEQTPQPTKAQAAGAAS